MLFFTIFLTVWLLGLTLLVLWLFNIIRIIRHSIIELCGVITKFAKIETVKANFAQEVNK